jgi:hypothetical protein
MYRITHDVYHINTEVKLIRGHWMSRRFDNEMDETRTLLLLVGRGSRTSASWADGARQQMDGGRLFNRGYHPRYLLPPEPPLPHIPACPQTNKMQTADLSAILLCNKFDVVMSCSSFYGASIK